LDMPCHRPLWDKVLHFLHDEQLCTSRLPLRVDCHFPPSATLSPLHGHRGRPPLRARFAKARASCSLRLVYLLHCNRYAPSSVGMRASATMIDSYGGPGVLLTSHSPLQMKNPNCRAGRSADAPSEVYICILFLSSSTSRAPTRLVDRCHNRLSLRGELTNGHGERFARDRHARRGNLSRLWSGRAASRSKST
jgi:hypothetical protein